MTGHRLEVADVFHAYQHQFLQRWRHALSDQQRKVLRDIGLCRTAGLGTHLERCDRCSYETVSYDSCRNRHCPKCQSSTRDRWLLKQAASLLPVPYAHVVFTVAMCCSRANLAPSDFTRASLELCASRLYSSLGDFPILRRSSCTAAEKATVAASYSLTSRFFSSQLTHHLVRVASQGQRRG
jgi:Transposase zinc-binding domain